MKISKDAIKSLRDETSAGVIDCKKALEESNGDVNKAREVLKKKGLEIAAKKESRAMKEGRIESYVHLGNKIGVLVELSCETDFVARNEEFIRLAKELAMQVAAAAPSFIAKDDVPEELIKDQKDKESFYKTNCLLEQPFIKDPSVIIKDLIVSLIAKVGENIAVHRFTRFSIKDGLILSELKNNSEPR